MVYRLQILICLLNLSFQNLLKNKGVSLNFFLPNEDHCLSQRIQITLFSDRKETFLPQHQKAETDSNRLIIRKTRPIVGQTDLDFTQNESLSSKIRTKNGKFRAGQVSKLLHMWRKFGAPNNILAILSGYRIPFISSPPLYRFDRNSQ